jgi:hypothetical protein
VGYPLLEGRRLRDQGLPSRVLGFLALECTLDLKSNKLFVLLVALSLWGFSEAAPRLHIAQSPGGA